MNSWNATRWLLTGMIACSGGCAKTSDTAGVAIKPAQTEPGLAEGVYLATLVQCAGKNLLKSSPGYRSVQMTISTPTTANWSVSSFTTADATPCHQQLDFKLSEATDTGFRMRAQSRGENCHGTVRPEDFQTLSDDVGNAYAFNWTDGDHLQMTFTNLLELDSALCPSGSDVQVKFRPVINVSKAH